MFYLNALGGLALRSDSESLPASVHQRRRLALLVLLAAAGPRGISRDRLLAYLWPESSTRSAQHSLEQLLYATRRDLGRGAVVARGGQLQLSPETVWSDVADFEARLERCDWEGAITLYAGPFLDGVHLSGSSELECWVEAERSRLQKHFAEAVESAAREAEARGDCRTAVHHWRRRAAEEPLSARAALGLMQALAASGDRAGAIQHARTYCTLVRGELGAEPDGAVLALAETLAREPDPGRRQRPAPTPSEGLPRSDPPGAPLELASTAGLPSSAASAELGRESGPRPRRGGGGRAVALVVCISVLIGAAVLVLRRASNLPAQDVHVASVAVLPFENLSADPGAEYLGDGMSEELIHALAQLPDLRVSARTSAFAFKGRKEDIREIARALGVSAVVEGSVRRDGERLRVMAQLIDASTGYHLWSGSFDRRMGDALATQDEIARSVAQTLRPRLTGRGSPARSSHSPSARAYHLYLQGRYAWNQRTEASLGQAVRLFEQAIAEDASYAAAHAGLADAHDALADGGFAPAEASYREAEAAARRAIQLDGSLAEAHASLGHLRFHRWDWAGAEREFRRALELNPGYAGTYGYYAMPLVMRGRFDEGLAMMRRAQELDPLALGKHASMGWLLFLARRYDEAIDQLHTVIAMDSTRAAVHARLGAALVERGDHEAGIGALERAVELGGGYHRSALPMLGYAYAKAGRRGEAERIRVRVERGLTQDSINPYYGAAFMAALGDTDRAFALLDHAFRANRGCLIDLGVDPMMDGLRPDPRFAELARALGMDANVRGS